jgi:predicted O-linked N-acetylglucosamine transferase (SPINDLY family)
MNIDRAIQSAIDEYNKDRLEPAEALCNKILQKKPKHADSLNLLGLIFYERKNYDAAIGRIQKALQYDPNNFYFHNNLGTAYKAKMKLDEAITCYQKALQLNPNFADAHNNLGTVLQGKRYLDEAMTCYQKALQLNPNFADAYFNLGTAFRVKGQMDEAIACYRKALQLNPNFVEAYNNLGVDFKERGELREALTYFQRVLELSPQFVEAYNNIGSILGDQGKIEDAERYYRHALQMKPDFSVCYSNLLLSMNYSPRHDNRTLYLEHLNFAKQFADPLSFSIPPHTNERIPLRRLRIGYVSPDFRRHSVNYFIEPVLAAHDREQFEVFCYSDVISPDEVTKHVQTYPLQWRDIVGMSDEQVSGLVRSDKIDILVDLAGHTGNNRMLLFARKPAPVQVSWLGYPNTTGLAAVDYRIVDNYTDPPGMTDQFYTEKLSRMPECFLCYQPEQDSPEIGPLPSQQKGFITFGSFNIISKITPEAVALWSRILKTVPNSTLLLKARSLFDKGTREYLGGLFMHQGIPEDRLTFMFHTESYQQHLGLYNEIDIGLDTFPYNGTTTTCEALWMGVPVVTLAGDRHASRVGASLLSAIGLSELIAKTDEEYLETAVALAHDIDRLQSLRERLRDRMKQSPLINAERFTVNLENCLREMWQQYCAGHSG